MGYMTRFETEDIKQMLLPYALDELVSFAPISEGSVQTNYKISTVSGSYVLRYYENRAFGQVMFEIQLMQKLMTAGFPCAPLILLEKAPLLVYKGKPFALFEFVTGKHVEQRSETQTKNLIHLLADLASITRSLNLDYADERLRYSVPDIENLVINTAAKQQTEKAARKCSWHLKELNTLELPQALSRSICHGDLYYTNILFDGEYIKALLDFDDANDTYMLFDIVSLIHFFKPDFDHETWHAFNREAHILDFRQAKIYFGIFESRLKIPAIDKKHVFDILKLAILIDCIWYFDRGDAHDFFEKRKIDALNQIGRKTFTEQVFG